ncbi:hypothetical protein LEP1GSC021_0557 [Leptospira noguchii str. 1993005606]|uniref:MORN repeat protein n=1 Tax=Leptospira noguchii str. 2007001578 TaxID=1049974 RepID=A0ABN0IYK7_9LEPT|nr:hypothetical protein LEP1GSC035_1145 [Leptospira noguchii str. 2007001578]EPE82295.1 hypothetical protein LEP1GSC021_0557 [Leptospira noguchii str. 1993005606]
MFFLFCVGSFSIFSQTKESCLFGDCKDGKGIFRDNFGNEYEGTFILGKLEGFVEVKFKNNETFSGIRNNSMKIGKGQRTDSNTGKLYMELGLRADFAMTTAVNLGVSLYPIQI